MPDASSHRPIPSGWSDAFAALPAETPPAGGWERVARALPAQRRRWPAWVALAAALGLVAVVPLRWSRQDAPATTTPIAGAPATSDPGRFEAARPAPATTAPGPADGGGLSSPDRPADASRDAAAIASAAIEPEVVPPPPTQAGPASPMDAPADDAPLLAAAEATRPDPVEPPAAPSELERLYAESAQFESLLALAREGRGEVANGAVAMLSDDLATRVARIDAALMLPSLAGERRLALWRERVDALRQAAAFESTQRLLAARGERYDAMLVSID